jgi:hypothetical protein
MGTVAIGVRRRRQVVCCARVSGWRASSTIGVAAVAVALALAGCAPTTRQDANEPSGNFPVAVTSATFPTSQRLSQHTHMVIKIRNTGNKTIPDLAITICNTSCQQPAQPGTGSGTEAFAELAAQPGLANPSRPVWIVDRPPGVCAYSCRSGGAGSDVTAYTNTWASGGLRPGATATFDFGVTAVVPGTHVVAYEVAAGLNGKAKAVTSGGGKVGGVFHVNISKVPQRSFVNDRGQIVSTQ